MLPLPGLTESGYGPASIDEANALLAVHHYLGPISGGRFILGERDNDGRLVQVQVWRSPTARLVQQDWLELSRWCILTRKPNAGSQMMGWVRRYLKQACDAPVLVSYSELGKHDGGLYRASGWEPLPTHHAERWLQDGAGYPSGHGSWDGATVQTPKMRWIIRLNKQVAPSSLR